MCLGRDAIEASMTALPILVEESSGVRADKMTGVYIPDELVTLQALSHTQTRCHGSTMTIRPSSKYVSRRGPSSLLWEPRRTARPAFNKTRTRCSK